MNPNFWSVALFVSRHLVDTRCIRLPSRLHFYFETCTGCHGNAGRRMVEREKFKDKEMSSRNIVWNVSLLRTWPWIDGRSGVIGWNQISPNSSIWWGQVPQTREGCFYVMHLLFPILKCWTVTAQPQSLYAFIHPVSLGWWPLNWGRWGKGNLSWVVTCLLGVLGFLKPLFQVVSSAYLSVWGSYMSSVETVLWERGEKNKIKK